MSEPNTESTVFQQPAMPTPDDYQKMFCIRQILQAFIDKNMEFPSTSELAAKFEIAEEHVSRLVFEMQQQIQSLKESQVRGIVFTTFKSLVQQNLKPDYTVDQDGIASVIESDKTCCSCRLSADYGMCRDKIDELKQNVINDVIRETKLNDIMTEYGLNN